MTRTGSTRRWRQLRAATLQAQPLCRIRIPGTCTIIATTVDHILPVERWPHLEYEPTNLQGACRACNRRKWNLTMAELWASLDDGQGGLDDEPEAAGFFD